MTMIEAMSRIGEIQTTIAQLSPQRTPQVETRSTGREEGAGVRAADSSFADALTRAASTALEETKPSEVTAARETKPARTEAAEATTATSKAADEPKSSGGTDGDDIVAAARKYLGVPYVWGGESLSEGGFDCSGLVQKVFGEFDIDLPRVARQQMHSGTEVASLAEARPGDLIVTRGGGHIMIYIGDNKVLHAPRPGQDVQIRDMFETDADIDTIRRIVPAGGGS